MSSTACQEWLTVPQVARMLRVGRPAVERLIRDGELTSRAVPGAWVRVSLESVERLIERCTTTSRAS